MSEIDNLREKLRELHLKNTEEEEIKKLKHQIFRLEHKKLIKVSDTIENTGKGIVNLLKKTGKKTIEAGKNYDKNTKRMSMEEHMNIIK